MTVLKSYDKNFTFLGNRHYVQGSSITTGLLEALVNWQLGTIEKLRANIHSLLNQHGRYDLFNKNDKLINLGKNYNAIFDVVCNNRTYVVGLKETGVPVSTSEPYDEEHLIKGYDITESTRSITFNLYPGHPLVQILIALNKKLVGSIYPSEGYGQWLLIRYDLNWTLTHIKKPALLTIQVAGMIGLGHTNSAIHLGGNPIGSIFFSRKRL